MVQTPTAQVSATPAPGRSRKSLTFVVHGFGEQPKSTELQVATEGFLPLIRRRLDPEAIISARPADDSGPAEVQIQFKGLPAPDPPGRPQYDARFVEVWWQAAFSAPGLGQMFMGFFSILSRWGKTQAWGAKDDKDRSSILGFAIALGFLAVRLLLNILVFIPLMLFVMIAAPVCSIIAFVTYHRAYPNGPWVLPRPVRSLFLRIFDLTTKAQPLIVEIGLGILSPLIVLLLFLLWLFETILPAAWLGPLESLHLGLVKLITRSWGDLWLYAESPWQASRIRVRFEQEFTDAIEKLDGDIDTVVLIAHSMGAAIVYEALTGPRLRPLLEETFGPDPETARFQGKPRLHLVTLGSALNIVWTVVSDGERHRFVRPLPAYIDWLNLWAYLDPYARQALRIPDEAYQVRPSLAHPTIHQPVRESEVINQQDMFSDHSAYWNNAAQVVAPVLDILTSRDVEGALKLDIERRMLRVSTLSFFKALAWSIPVFVFFGLLGYVHFFNDKENWPGPGTAALVRDGCDWLVGAFPAVTQNIVTGIVGAVPDPLIGLAPPWLSDGVSEDEIWDKFFSPYFVAGLFAIIATTVYSTVVKWVWDLWDQGHKYDQPRLK